MKYSIVKNNKLSFTERESLFLLVNEELIANKQCSNSRKEQKTHNIFYIGAFTNYIR